MQIKFVSLELNALDRPTPQWIEESLASLGQPLRWAITAVDGTVYRLEAVVLMADIQ